MIKEPNEIRILREFLVEFNPLCTFENIEGLAYNSLVMMVKETIREM